MKLETKQNLLGWLLYSGAIYLILLPFGMYFTAISISLIIGFFASLINRVIISLNNITEYSAYKMKTYTIDLDNYIDGNKILITRPKAIEIKNKSHLDKSYKKFRKIEVVIPSYVLAVNPSFIEEFIKTPLLDLGEAEFKRRFVFINKSRCKFEEDLQNAIDIIMREKNYLKTN